MSLFSGDIRAGSDSEDETKDRSLHNEAHRVVKEIKFGVLEAHVSEKLVHTDSIAFINIKTFEKQEWCIELTASGYAIVSQKFDTIKNSEHDEVYETVEALMNRISPEYLKIFNEKVSEKLNQLH